MNLGPRSYDIEIGSGNLGGAGRFCRREPVSHAVVITDENVQKPHAIAAAESLAEVVQTVDLVVVEPGEQSKSIDTAADALAGTARVGRRPQEPWSWPSAAAWSATWPASSPPPTPAGIRFLQVPTTLLAQVDSSVGGKVGINLPEAKNMVGAFLQPLGVLIDTATLDTLPEREYRSGLGEVVKYGVILDAELFAYLEAHAAGLLAPRPRRAAPRDRPLLPTQGRRGRSRTSARRAGLRAVLNYGHTFGHALETLAGYGKLLHGEAVAIGMVCAARLAERLGRVDARFTGRQRGLLERLGLPTRLPELDRRADPGGDDARQEGRARPAAASCCRRGWDTSSWSTTLSRPTSAALTGKQMLRPQAIASVIVSSPIRNPYRSPCMTDELESLHPEPTPTTHRRRTGDELVDACGCRWSRAWGRGSRQEAAGAVRLAGGRAGGRAPASCARCRASGPKLSRAIAAAGDEIDAEARSRCAGSTASRS